MSIICNFSGIYDLYREELNEGCLFIDMKDIKGTCGYCSDDAICSIRGRLASVSAQDVHLIDNGNYHYLTKLWIEKLDEKFDLIVFDHHTDMQQSAFGDVLSCGSWILHVLDDDNIKCNKIILIGPPKDSLRFIDNKFRDRLIYIPEEDIEDFLEDDDNVFLKMYKSEFPLYISIDKDLISKSEFMSNWDQGNICADQIIEIIKKISINRKIIGADICGEPDINFNSVQINKSKIINEKLRCVFGNFVHGKKLD